MSQADKPATMTARQEKWFASILESMERDTGKPLEEWVAIARTCPETKPGARKAWFKAQHGIGTNRASVILGMAFPEAAVWAQPENLRDTLWADDGSRDPQGCRGRGSWPARLGVGAAQGLHDLLEGRPVRLDPPNRGRGRAPWPRCRTDRRSAPASSEKRGLERAAEIGAGAGLAGRGGCWSRGAAEAGVGPKLERLRPPP